MKVSHGPVELDEEIHVTPVGGLTVGHGAEWFQGADRDSVVSPLRGVESRLRSLRLDSSMRPRHRFRHYPHQTRPV